MKKILIIAGSVVVTAGIAAAFFLMRENTDIVVVLKPNSISPITNVLLTTSKEAFTIPVLDGKEIQQVIFKDTKDVYALKFDYKVGDLATSSSFYVEPGYRVDLRIGDSGYETFYVFE